MSLFRLILRNLFWFRRQHLALFAGTVVAVAVLTGALIVGDSVRQSLKNITETRLGNIRYEISTGGRFVTTVLAEEIGKSIGTNVSPVLILNGTALSQEKQTKINRIQVVGIDSGFWSFASKPLPVPEPDEAILSRNTSEKLGLVKGDAILVRVEQTGLIPVNSPFSPEKRPSIALRLTVADIADDKSLGRFSLRSNQVSPYTIFLNLGMLGDKLGLAGLANAILVGGTKSSDISVEKINDAFAASWKPLDAGLIMKGLPGGDRYEVISNRVFIDKQLTDVVDRLSHPNEKVITYLVNSFRKGEKSTPYSFISATTYPFLTGEINSGEMAITDWLANDLGAKQGDTLQLKYFVIGPLRRLIEKTSDLRVSGIIPVKGNYVDPTLMPDFPGLSDAGSCRDWNTGVPIDLKKIRDKDEQYWNDYRGTPKALISLTDGLKLWSNPFGECTSIRFERKNIQPDSLLNEVMQSLKPQELGMTAIPVYEEGLSSAENSLDFGELFLELSFFILTAGILLIILIFSLNLSSRRSETAILSGLGLSPRTISKIRIYESFFVILPGSIAGAFAGILYNFILVKALNTVWQGALQASMLEVSIKPVSLFLGAGIGFLLAFATVIFITRRNLSLQVYHLLRGSTQFTPAPLKTLRRWNKTLALFLLFAATAIVFYSLFSGAYENPVLFLSAGGLLLTSSIFAFVWFLEKIQYKVHNSGISIFTLAMKNVARNRGRSIAVISLLAIGVFSIILTGAYRKTFTGTENITQSGTGGFQYWSELSVPIAADLNDPEVQNKYLVTGIQENQQIHFEQFPGIEGDDASCLNLNQVNRPRILGIDPESFNNRKSFSFISLLNDTMKINPWLQLKKPLGKNIIPGFADQTVIQYGLRKSVGDTLFYLDESGAELKIVLIGGLGSSVFQGSLLIDKSHLMKHFPSAAVCKTMLIEVPENKDNTIENLLNQSFTDYGIDLTSTAARLAEFNKVTNTYLSVFMILGGLGLIIGSVGLGIVLFRNAEERKHEFGLLSALGINRKQISRLIFYENILLLASGLCIGLISAIVAVLPSFLLPGFQTQTAPLAMIMLLLVLSGLVFTWVPSRLILKGRLMDAIRNE